jgi:hypothetical protein
MRSTTYRGFTIVAPLPHNRDRRHPLYNQLLAEVRRPDGPTVHSVYYREGEEADAVVSCQRWVDAAEKSYPDFFRRYGQPHS